MPRIENFRERRFDLSLQQQRHLMRWGLFGLFGTAFAVSTAVHLSLLFLVGFGEIDLPQALLIALGAATVGNVFPGLIYALAFAFGRMPESE